MSLLALSSILLPGDLDGEIGGLNFSADGLLLAVFCLWLTFLLTSPKGVFDLACLWDTSVILTGILSSSTGMRRLERLDLGLRGLTDDLSAPPESLARLGCSVLGTITVRDLLGLAGADEDFLFPSLSPRRGDKAAGVEVAEVAEVKSVSNVILAESSAFFRSIEGAPPPGDFLSALTEPDPVFLLERFTGECGRFKVEFAVVRPVILSVLFT